MKRQMPKLKDRRPVPVKQKDRLCLCEQPWCPWCRPNDVKGE